MSGGRSRFLAAGPEGGLDASSDINAITWQNNGSLCAISGNSQAACNQPYECCNFRTSYGCGSDLLAQGELFDPDEPSQFHLALAVPADSLCGHTVRLTSRQQPCADAATCVAAISRAVLASS